MWIFCSMIFVTVSLIICSKFYKKMFPGMKLISRELVLLPFRFKTKFSFYLIHLFCFSLRIPDVTERLGRSSVGRTFASDLVFVIWAVFGGFILHFLLSNYLTVLLRPSYEKPVETAEDLINRNIIPFCAEGGEIFRQFFADSPDPIDQEISQRLLVANDWDEYEDMVSKVIPTGLFADIGFLP